MVCAVLSFIFDQRSEKVLSEFQVAWRSTSGRITKRFISRRSADSRSLDERSTSSKRRKKRLRL
nr:MAG TPA: hypothetical protein [Caudoviricetes sp.]